MATVPKSHSVWHEGELEVQRRAGVRDDADELTGMYKREIPAAIAGFLAQQQFAVLSTIDPGGRVWASLVAGEPGIIDVRDPFSVAIRHTAETKLPLDDIQANPQIGVIAVDFSRRIRIRVNGRARIEGEDVVIAIDQLYGNCSRYIQKRVLDEPSSAETKVPIETGQELSPSQREFISRADTFFVASRHPELGADVSHRGGKPGFAEAGSPARITFPDYDGNKMFNTLGNLTVNPALGLLFFDFGSGRVLQISGRASVDWDPARAAQFPLAQRVIDVDIEAVRDTRCATSLRYRFIGYSPSLG